MHLERANSGSGEAGLAGWISSNDVTLFTVVMVVVIAVFLRANFVKSTRKNVTLQAEYTSLSGEHEELKSVEAQTQLTLQATQQQLAETTAELDTTESDLKNVQNNLAAASEQLKQTQLALTETQDSLQQTQADLDRVMGEKTSLETEYNSQLAQIKTLNESLAALQIDKQQLEQDRTQLTMQRTELSQTKEELDKELAELAVQLKQRLGDLDNLKRERDLLEQQATSLNERVAKLEQQLGDRQEELVELKQTNETEMLKLQELLTRAMAQRKSDQEVSAQELAAMTSKIDAAGAEAEKAQALAEDYLDRLRRAAVLVRGMDENKKLLTLEVEALKTQLANALDDLDAARQQMNSRVSRDRAINRELVGLKGELRRVAILFDSSGSMNESGRWEEVQRIAATWLDHLDVDECVLIVFSSDVRTFPEDGTMSAVSGEQGDANRAKLLERLQSVKPAGWTNTLAAMRKAYEYEGLDTIVLFSDGAPTGTQSGTFNEAAAQQIYSLCRQHADIPVNAIGLGNYFDQELSTFLRTVAELTNGTFLGR